MFESLDMLRSRHISYKVRVSTDVSASAAPVRERSGRYRYNLENRESCVIGADEVATSGVENYMYINYLLSAIPRSHYNKKLKLHKKLLKIRLTVINENKL